MGVHLCQVNAHPFTRYVPLLGRENNLDGLNLIKWLILKGIRCFPNVAGSNTPLHEPKSAST